MGQMVSKVNRIVQIGDRAGRKLAVTDLCMRMVVGQRMEIKR